MLTKNPTNIAKLNDELREFAEDMPVIVVRPPREDLIAAVEPHFPELVEEATYLHEFLDPVGIAVIVRIGKDIFISWSVADSAEEASEQVEKYSQPVYCEIRKALGIQYHWVVKVRPNFWGYDDNTVVERYGGFAQLPTKPDCWILDLG
jgi:hypothetical protein